ncbi:MAG TPA: metal/formaldehyde-sensitive transcriptional repressor [Terriglobales bacterium]|jgi:DNA-binding FrmR family transcriptional regulator|nr:metal/formaldehyde-sensitive transcriptional repressor [Terriglobales bacterium]
MAHILQDQEKLIQRVRRIRGQVEALERSIATEQDCSEVLQLITSARGAMNGLMAEVLEGHIRYHVVNPKEKASSERMKAAEELIAIVRSYLS